MPFETLLTQDRIDAETTAGHWAGTIITDYLDEVAARTPDKVAFTDSRRQVSYRELQAEVNRCALGLLELGVGPGDVISFQLPNWIEFVVLHFAATRIGAISNPLIPIYREREISFMVGLAASKVIVVPREFRGFDHLGMIGKLRGSWPALEHVLVLDGDPGEDMSWTDFMATPWEERRDPAELAKLRPDANQVTLLIFSSGTTGEPKGVMHTHNTLVAANHPLAERLGITSDSVIHMASTLAHLTGFLYGARLPIQNGASGVLQDIWDPARFVELIAEHHVTYTSAATPFLHDLLTAPNLDVHDVSSLIRFCCMGAPIPRAMVRRARQQLPSMVVVGGWGQTEDGLVTLGIPGDPDDKIIDTDGYPWPGMRIRVLDPDGHQAPPGTEGRLQVTGPFLFVGYAERLEMTRSCFDGEWFDTGDLASIDADGYLKISGRTKDVIIRGGENIPVVYVENALYENPKLAKVAVVSVPDPRLQERACACVVLAPGAGEFTLAEMQEFLAAKGVAKPYWPERLEILNELPSTPSGKIQKFELRNRFGGEE